MTKTTYGAAILAVFTMLFSVLLGAKPAGASTHEPSWNRHAHFKLILDDEFNGSHINTRLWNTGWFGTGITPPVNQGSPRNNSANLSEHSGTLNLKLTQKYGSLVDTDGKFSMTHGRIEWRAYIPASANGRIAGWPALWTDGQRWPTDGEIDVMEGLGGTAAYHYHSPAGDPGRDVTNKRYTGWHTFGVYWVPGTVQFFYDGKSVGQIHRDIRNKPMYLIMVNTRSSSSLRPGSYPATLRIDWARAWDW